jgi:dTDP-4-dehydrorhamnose 3,5-epimerase-like enzyme
VSNEDESLFNLQNQKIGLEIASTTFTTSIDGVTLMKIPTVKYEYGELTEIFHPQWETIYLEPITHMYIITNGKNKRHEWHVHHETFDRYLVIEGEIEIALHDARKSSRTKRETIVIKLSGIGTSGNHGLRIPPGVYHTFRSVTEGFTMLNNKSLPYNRENPDKFVVPFWESGIAFQW